MAGRVVQPLRFALLALLATAPRTGLSRDTLLALLWPEARPRSARHRLAAALHDLRRTLGSDAIATLGDRLSLETTLVRSDLAEFKEALAAQDLERVVAVYGGPFLDGFYVTRNYELERWIEETRSALGRRYAEAAATLAQARTSRGDAAGALEAWLAVAAASPFDARVAVRVIEAFERAGDRAGGLRHAAGYEALVRRELETEPDIEVVELADRLRERAGTPVPDGPADPDVEPATAHPVHSPAGAGRWWRRPAAAATSVLALALVAGVALNDRGEPAPLPATPRVVVLPFEVRGEGETAELREGIVHLLSLNLDGTGVLRAVDPRAVLTFMARDSAPATRAVVDRFGANLYVEGRLFLDGDKLRVHAEMRSPGSTGPLARATVDAASGQLLMLIDEVTARLLEGVLPAAAQRIAARTTRSVPALREYLRGESHFRAGRFVPAAQAFERAVTEDSTFALAHYRLALSIIWADRYDASPHHAERQAVRYKDRLAERERVLVEAFAAWREGRAAEAEHLYRRVAAAYPDNVEAWFQLGETLFHYNPLRGRPIVEARDPFERVLVHDPDHWGALWHLAGLAAFERQPADFERLTDRLLRLGPDEARSLEVRALRGYVMGDADERENLLAELRASDPQRLFTVGWRAAVFAHDLDGAMQVFALLADRARSGRTTGIGSMARAHLKLALGQIRAARAELLMTALDGQHDWWGHSLGMRAHMVAFPFVQSPRTELESIRDRLDMWAAATAELTAEQAAHRRILALYLAGQISVALGDTADALRRAAEVERQEPLPASSPPVAYAHALRAAVHRRGGRLLEALALLDRDRSEWYGFAISSGLAGGHHERWARAEILHALGRHAEALDWYGSFGEHSVFDLPYLAPAHLRRAEIHERLGNSAVAAEHYRCFIQLWRNADPELQPEVERAKRLLLAIQTTSSALPVCEPSKEGHLRL